MSTTPSREQATAGVVRRGRIAWLTHPPSGRASIEAESHAFHALPVSVPDGDPVPYEATPGELLAITHSTFLAAYLSEALERAGTPARELVVSGACTFDGPMSDRELTAIDLHVRGRVADIGVDEFRDAATAAWRQTLRGAGIREELPGTVVAELA
jgi:hypothetical protein